MRNSIYIKNKKSDFKQLLLILPLLVFVIFILSFDSVYASQNSIIDSLKKEISKYSQQVKDLEKEAKEYEEKLHVTAKEKNTLSNQVRTLEDDIAHLNLNIKKTQSEITETQLNIDLLSEEISEKNKSIVDLRSQMGYILQLIYESNNKNLFSLILSTRNFSTILNKKEYLTNLEEDVSASLIKIKNLKFLLEQNKKEQLEKRESLAALNESMFDQQSITKERKRDKDNLLRETKNKEAKYQKTLTALNKKRKNIQREVGSLEKKLQDAIDRSKLPQGNGILKWPLDKIRMTQDYGMTRFARTGAYGGNIHNGLDLAGATGTIVRAAQDGEVIGVGNNGRYAYGKWIAVRHDNGLITLYAHMSLQKVKKGQRVSTGQLIGYVGATGYVTGPHLHFTVYAPGSFGLRQSAIVSWLKIPFGAPLNPHDYL